MSVLLDRPTVRQPSKKSGAAKLGQKSSVFPSLKSSHELGRISPQRPLISLYAEILDLSTRSSLKFGDKGWAETSQTKNVLLSRLSEKVTKLYRDFKIQRND